IAYNDILVDDFSWTELMPLDPTQSNVETCATSRHPVVSNAYAISRRPQAPWIIGSPCADIPRIGMYASGDSSIFTSLSYYAETRLISESLGPEMQHLLIQNESVWREQGIQKGVDFERANGIDEFMKISFLTLKLLNQQCGNWPRHIDYHVFMGATSEDLWAAPDLMMIRGSWVGRSYEFKFANLETAQELNAIGKFVEQRNFEASAEFLRQRQEDRRRLAAEWSTPEAKFALGALMVAGALTSMALSSPCWDNPNNFAC
ncbi:MAG: hypothetical protein ABJJ69_15470, partial [Paracoccaceae bacterium]